MHGFDCILCHCPGSKCDKRTACKGGTIGEGRVGQEETKQDKRFGQLIMNPKKHITVQRMATPKHTEPPSLVSTWRNNTTKNSNTCHTTTVIDSLNCHPRGSTMWCHGETINVIIYTHTHIKYTQIHAWHAFGLCYEV